MWRGGKNHYNNNNNQDTSGEERFRSMQPMYYRGAAAAVICCDSTRHSSFENMKSWVRELLLSVNESTSLEDSPPPLVNNSIHNNNNNSNNNFFSGRSGHKDDPNRIILTIACNKMDLEDQLQVSHQELQDFGDSIGAPVFETSSLKNTGIDQVFLHIGKMLIKQKEILSSRTGSAAVDSLDFSNSNSIRLDGSSRVQKKEGGCSC